MPTPRPTTPTDALVAEGGDPGGDGHTDRAPRTDLLASTSLCAVFQDTVNRVPDRPALRTHDGDDEVTWGAYGEQVRAAAGALAGLRVVRGGAVALMLSSRPAFHVLDTAALHVGAVAVSVYNTLPAEDVGYQLRDSGAAVLVVDDEHLDVGRRAADAAGVPVLTVDAPRDGVAAWDDLPAPDPSFDFDATWRAVGTEDLAVVIYTSGTTGSPKGVELTHGAILGNQQGIQLAIGSPDGGKVISFLPMAHIAERHLSHYRAMVCGLSVTCCPDPRSVPAALAALRPHDFFSPPRLFEKFRAAILAGVGRMDDDEATRIREAIETGVAVLRLRHEGRDVPADMEDVAQRLRTVDGPRLLATLGLDRIEVALTGAAPTPFELVAFFRALGLPLLEAWGLTECGAFGAFNRPDDWRIGTVGRPLPGVEMRLLDDGEVLLRSPWLMRGYRHRPQDTAAAFDADGWLHSGDVGLLEQGFLKIVDRKKELIINAAGKNMSPANIEAKLKQGHPLIGQACVVGDGRPYNVALLVLDPDAAAAHASRHGLDATDLETFAAHPTVVDAIAAGVALANAGLSRVEQIKRFVLLPEEWAPGGDELTPTMKLKRRPIGAKYASTIDGLYRDPPEGTADVVAHGA